MGTADSLVIFQSRSIVCNRLYLFLRAQRILVSRMHILYQLLCFCKDMPLSCHIGIYHPLKHQSYNKKRSLKYLLTCTLMGLFQQDCSYRLCSWGNCNSQGYTCHNELPQILRDIYSGHFQHHIILQQIQLCDNDISCIPCTSHSSRFQLYNVHKTHPL